MSVAVKSDKKYTYADYLTWPDEEKTTVVQPDISVVCEKRKIDERGCNGAPDLVVEILS